MEIFEKFNSMLISKGGVGVITHDGDEDVNSSVRYKGNGDILKRCIETAILESICADSVLIWGVSELEYGYKLALDTVVKVDGHKYNSVYYITYNSLY